MSIGKYFFANQLLDALIGRWVHDVVDILKVHI